MSPLNPHIERLKREVLQRFGRTLDAPTDYDALSLDILKRCGEQVSASTLKRLYGYNKRATTPRPSTLSTLARYAGYAGWSHLCETPVEDDLQTPPVEPAARKGWLWWFLGALLLLLTVGLFVLSRRDAKPYATVEPTVAALADEPYDALRRKWVALTIHKCDSIRQYRSQSDVFAYAELIDQFYYPFVFTSLKEGVAHEVELLETGDSLADAVAREEIFILCRDLCLELSREIADELREEGIKRVEALNREIH